MHVLNNYPPLMGSDKHHNMSRAIILFVVILFYLFLCCYGSRKLDEVRYTKLPLVPKKSFGSLQESLPRAMPIPPSGPSVRHNSINFIS
ncbi:hypothetical protein IHE45_14G065300 [Dioscorea alata]|uniref:Uncharacterized protein n=1 Tax=Dioscorea alata TaxID=55571 RepID=A0ACB7US92_DIOAL|nr:hypothetical protein IHE45_14G065300 [Dioscorea alata]